MSNYVLCVRPEPGLAQTMAAGEALGLNMIGYPLFEIAPRAWACPDPATVDALLIGSANAMRHGGEGLARLTAKPVFAVGRGTAEAARRAGFEVKQVGEGGLQALLDQIAGPLRLLRIAGAEHVPLTAQAGVSVDTVIAYEALPLELPEPLRPLHDLGLTVLLHSAAAARQFASECRRLALQRERITLAVIGPRVAEAAGSGWRSIHVSPAPNDAAMLEMMREMCI